MKKLLIALLILIVAAVGAWKLGLFGTSKKQSGSKDEPIPISKHSDDFNQSMTKAMDAYYALTESFVNWDTSKVNASIAALKISVDSMRIPEMERDSMELYKTAESFWESIKAVIMAMQADTGLYAKREDFNSLSQQFYDLLRTVQYDAAKVFYQECPMALNNYESSAFWLSAKAENKERRNPYLGLYDPKYGRAMLTCGTTRDSINFAETSPGK